MFAFGVRVRTVLRVAVVETLLTSLAGTALGCALGAILLVFMMQYVFTTTVPDIDVAISLQPQTLLTAVLIGVIVAVVTPLLNGRRLLRINIPSALFYDSIDGREAKTCAFSFGFCRIEWFKYLG